MITDQLSEHEKEQENLLSTTYPILARYGRDLTKEAREGKLAPVAGWEDQVELCIKTVARRTRSSAILIGGSRVDRLAIVEAVAQHMASGDVPESLKNKKLISLDLGAWLNGAEFPGKFLERLQIAINEIKQLKGELSSFLKTYLILWVLVVVI